MATRNKKLAQITYEPYQRHLLARMKEEEGGWKEGRKVEVYEAAMEWDSVENDTAVRKVDIIIRHFISLEPAFWATLPLYST